MSYRRTWLLVDEMNRCFRQPVVAARAGGGRDRGACLTDAGHRALSAFRELEAQSAALADSAAYTSLTDLLRACPVSARAPDPA